MATREERLHVVQLLGDFGRGGDGRVARDLSTALARRGARSTCVALRSRADGVPCGGSVEVIRLGADRGVRSSLAALRSFRRYVARESPDLVHVHGPQSLVFAATALVASRGRPPLWFTWHDSGAVLGMSSPRRCAVRWAMRRCSRVFGSSRGVADRLQALLPSARRVDVFRNGVEELPPTTGIDAEEPLVVWAARFVPPKDPLIFVRACGRLVREGLRFRVLMAGSAPANQDWLERQVRELVRESGLTGVVEMPGWLEDATVPCRAAAIGVQTSHTEGLSITLLEHMMAGMAVIATDVGDTSGAIERDRSGLLIQPSDEDALCDALRRLITDVSLRRRLGDAARLRAQAEFSLDVMWRQVTGMLVAGEKA